MMAAHMHVFAHAEFWNDSIALALFRDEHDPHCDSVVWAAEPDAPPPRCQRTTLDATGTAQRQRRFLQTGAHQTCEAENFPASKREADVPDGSRSNGLRSERHLGPDRWKGG